MKDILTSKIAELTFLQILGFIGFVVLCIIALLIAIAIAFDKLNVKSFSFRNGFTFYQEGDEKRTRITHRKKTVRHKASK